MTWFERHPRTTIAATIVGLLGLADVAAGLAFTQGDHGAEPSSPLARYVAEIELHQHRVPSEVFHHGFRPNDRFETEWGPTRTMVATNSLGLRDAAPREIEADRGRRVVILGDSFVEGVSVPYEKTFVGLAADRLAPQGIEVLNAGVAGYSPKLYYLKLRWLLEEAHLKIEDVVVFIDTSDPHNEIEYEAWEPTDQGQRHAAPLRRVLESVARWSFTGRTLNAAARRWQARGDESRLELLRKIDGELYSFDDPEVAERWGRHGLDLCEQYMQRLADLCRAQGIRLTVAVHPSSVQVFAGAVRPPWVERWQRFAQRNAVEFLDFFPVFLGPEFLRDLQSAPRGITPWYSVVQRFYIPGDVHWNEEGHRLVAERLRLN